MGGRRRTVSGADDDSYDIGNPRDVEKNDFGTRDSSIDSDTHGSLTAWSKDRSYGSQDSMLHKSSTPRRTKSASYFLYRVPNRTVRWLCLLLMSAIVLFMMTLVRASWNSARLLESGLGRAPPPPAVWESFGFLKRYHGGIRTLVSRADNVPEYPKDSESIAGNATVAGRNFPESIPYRPYPDYASTKYKQEYATVSECFLDEEDKIKVPVMHAYPGVPQGMPEAIIGSHALTGIQDTKCFDRYGKLGPYGFGYSMKMGGIGAGLEGEREGSDNTWKDQEQVDYTRVKWGQAQMRCSKKNKHRFESADAKEDPFRHMAAGSSERPVRRDEPPSDFAPVNKTHTGSVKIKLSQTAIVIRTWTGFQYTPDDTMYLRSLLAELSLVSGGEYTIHFLVHVKDDNAAIWADPDKYNKVLNDALPKEFADMGTLWSERQMGLIYGGLAESFYRNLPVHGVYRSTFMPLQYFAHQHPEYEHFWNWEMDVRYTGHWYHFMDSVRRWAKAQPRKGLWERSGRFYIPKVHGSWEDFKQMVRVQTEMALEHPNKDLTGLKATVPAKGAAAGKADKPIWGPLYHDDTAPLDSDPIPPTTYDKDKYTLGVSEEADLITFLPIFDPENTDWILAEDVTGYNKSYGLPPRRTAIVTASRLSRRLLNTMHSEVTSQHHTMFSEMWPASCALHHGLKAVYVPHPIYIDRDWPPAYLNSIVNGGKNGATGGSRMSVFGDARQSNLAGISWYYNSGFGPNLWRRWLGYRVDGDGGEEQEVAGEGRMCLPAMLLHPVKNVEIIVEGILEE